MISETLSKLIRFNGPLTVAQYMRHCLLHPTHGYYMHKDVFNKRGDFITSPEISQIFGEVLGAWIGSRMSKNSSWQLVELGPGRGTLLSDMWRTWKAAGSLKSLESIHLVEPSLFLRRIQLEQLRSQFHVENIVNLDKDQPVSAILDGLPLAWHDTIDTVPSVHPPMIVAHELFDALPVHMFKNTSDGWRELMVDVNESDDIMKFKFVLDKEQSVAAKALVTEQNFPSKLFAEEDVIEVSPDSALLVKQFSKLIQSHSDGCAVVVDYGEWRPPGNTFRGIRNHAFVHPLENSGEQDLTADVSFSYLAQNVADAPKIRSYPLLTQREFLLKAGAPLRLQRLLAASNSGVQSKDILSRYGRIVGSGKDRMGDLYKFWMMGHKDANESLLYPFATQGQNK